MKIAVFYHCLFYYGSPLVLHTPACEIVAEQMFYLKQSELEEKCNELVIGINGPVEKSRAIAEALLPAKAKLIFHGPDSFSENLTIVALENWLRDGRNPDEWYVLYFHAKGATHAHADPLRTKWRQMMMWHLIGNWRQCLVHLDWGLDAAGCNWRAKQGVDQSQNIFAGNFWWARGAYLKTLPSIWNRDRIKMSGIASAESRYEAEVWIGNGRELPKVVSYQPGGFVG